MARSLSPIGVQQDLSGRIFDIQSYSVHDGPGCVRWYFYLRMIRPALRMVCESGRFRESCTDFI